MCLGFLPACRARSGLAEDRRRLTAAPAGLGDAAHRDEEGLGIIPGAQRVHALAPVRQEPRPHRQLALGQEVERDRLDVPLLVDPLDALFVGARRVDGLAEDVPVPDQGQVDARPRDQAVREPRAPAGHLGDLEAAVAPVALELDDAVARDVPSLAGCPSTRAPARDPIGSRRASRCRTGADTGGACGRSRRPAVFPPRRDRSHPTTARCPVPACTPGRSGPHGRGTGARTARRDCRPSPRRRGACRRSSATRHWAGTA